MLWFEQQYELSRQKRDQDDSLNGEVIGRIVTSHHNDDLAGEMSNEIEISASDEAAIPVAPVAFSSPSSSNVSSDQSQETENPAEKRSEKKTHFLPPNDPYWQSQWYLVSNIHDSTNSKLELIMKQLA